MSARDSRINRLRSYYVKKPKRDKKEKEIDDIDLTPLCTEKGTL